METTPVPRAKTGVLLIANTPAHTRVWGSWKHCQDSKGHLVLHKNVSQLCMLILLLQDIADSQEPLKSLSD